MTQDYGFDHPALGSYVNIHGQDLAATLEEFGLKLSSEILDLHRRACKRTARSAQVFEERLHELGHERVHRLLQETFAQLTPRQQDAAGQDPTAID